MQVVAQDLPVALFSVKKIVAGRACKNRGKSYPDPDYRNIFVDDYGRMQSPKV